MKQVLDHCEGGGIFVKLLHLPNKNPGENKKTLQENKLPRLKKKQSSHLLNREVVFLIQAQKINGGCDCQMFSFNTSRWCWGMCGKPDENTTQIGSKGEKTSYIWCLDPEMLKIDSSNLIQSRTSSWFLGRTWKIVETTKWTYVNSLALWCLVIQPLGRTHEPVLWVLRVPGTGPHTFEAMKSLRVQPIKCRFQAVYGEVQNNFWVTICHGDSHEGNIHIRSKICWCGSKISTKKQSSVWSPVSKNKQQPGTDNIHDSFCWLFQLHDSKWQKQLKR